MSILDRDDPDLHSNPLFWEEMRHNFGKCILWQWRPYDENNPELGGLLVRVLDHVYCKDDVSFLGSAHISAVAPNITAEEAADVVSTTTLTPKTKSVPSPKRPLSGSSPAGRSPETITTKSPNLVGADRKWPTPPCPPSVGTTPLRNPCETQKPLCP